MATTGEKLARLGETVSENPYDDFTWTTPTNIYSDNAAVASVTSNSFDSGTITYVLKASNFDFSTIPDNSVITGVIVKINCYYSDAAVNMTLCQLLDIDHAKVGTNHASSPVALASGADSILTEGAAGDLWGNALTAAWVKDVDFGVALGFTSAGTNSEVRVDYVSMEIQYNAPLNAIEQTIGVKSSVLMWMAPFLLSSVVLREGAGINPATIIRVAESATISPQVVDTSVNINVSELTIGVAEDDPIIHPDPLQIYGIDTPIKVLSTTSVQADNILAYVLEGLKVAEEFSSWFDLFNFDKSDLSITVADSATVQPDNLLLDVSDTPLVPSDTIEIFRPELVLPVIDLSISVVDSTTIFRPELNLPVSEGIGISDTGEIQATELHVDGTEDTIILAEEATLFLPELVLPAIEETIGVAETIEVFRPELNVFTVEIGVQLPINITVADTGEIEVITLEGPDILLEKLEEHLTVAEETTIWREFVPIDIADGIGVSDSQEIFRPELVLPGIELTIGVKEQIQKEVGAPFIGELSVSGEDETIGVADTGEIQPTELHLDVSQPVVVTESSVLFLPEIVIPVAEAIGVSDTGEIAPTELHLDVTQPVIVADEGGIAVETEGMVNLSGSDGLAIGENAGINPATIIRVGESFIIEVGDPGAFVLNAIEDTITLAETIEKWTAEWNLNAVESSITVADTFTIPGANVLISVSEGIGVSEYAAPVVKYCIYVRDEATIFRPELNVVVSEAIGVKETGAIAPTELHLLAVEDTLSVADTATVTGGGWDPWCLDAATITEQVRFNYFTFLSVAEGIGIAESGYAGYWDVLLLDAATISENFGIEVEYPWLVTVTQHEGISVAESAAIAPTELHLSVAEGIGIAESRAFQMGYLYASVEEAIGVADSGEIQATELHIAPEDKAPILVTESTEIFRTTLNVPEIDVTITVADEATVHVAAVHISGEDAIAIAESITTFWNTKNVPEGEGIGVAELGWIHVEGTVYTPINMNFPLVDNITVAEEATLLRPTLFISVTELTIGIHETETTWMAERNVHGTEKTITVSESATIEKQAFGRCHVIWVEPHNRIVDVKPKHRKNWVDTQTREA